jgi:hypothetical protein
MLPSTFQANKSSMIDASPVCIKRWTVTALLISWILTNLTQNTRWKRSIRHLELEDVETKAISAEILFSTVVLKRLHVLELVDRFIAKLKNALRQRIYLLYTGFETVDLS